MRARFRTRVGKEIGFRSPRDYGQLMRELDVLMASFAASRSCNLRAPGILCDVLVGLHEGAELRKGLYNTS